MPFLPINRRDMDERGWESVDFVFVSGDAYVDHPAFGAAIITRLFEKRGFRVGVIAQPDWKSTEDIKRLGRPRLGFLVSSGVVDSMVNHYTANKFPRSEDLYSPGGVKGKRPNRALTVYCNLIRRAYRDIPILLGGTEASLRRFSHYDYWENKVRHSVLSDSGADLLIYGMGEKPVHDIADMLDKNVPLNKIRNVRGTCYIEKNRALVSEMPAAWADNDEVIVLPSFEEVEGDKKKYAQAFQIISDEQDAVRGRILVQKQPKGYIVQNPPALPMSVAEMDEVYDVEYMRAWHPEYDETGGIPAFDEIRFSITGHRGCFGGCSFCSVNYHQGRVIQKRSKESIFREAKLLTGLPDFKGYIHDVGGPTANFREKACKKQVKSGVCKRQCLFPEPCGNLDINYREYLSILRHIRKMDKVKKVFIRSGIRYDHLLLDKSGELFKEICTHHVSGQLKTAPEHVDNKVLYYMGKPGIEVYKRFVDKFTRLSEKIGKKQYIVPYLIASHPGSDLNSAIKLALFLKQNNIHPEQVQNFYPTPGTLSATMFYTGYDPRTMKKVYVPRSDKERAMQRALLQWSKPANADLIREALVQADREDLIGYGKNALIRPKKYRSSTPARKRKDGNGRKVTNQRDGKRRR